MGSPTDVCEEHRKVAWVVFGCCCLVVFGYATYQITGGYCFPHWFCTGTTTKFEEKPVTQIKSPVVAIQFACAIKKGGRACLHDNVNATAYFDDGMNMDADVDINDVSVQTFKTTNAKAGMYKVTALFNQEDYDFLNHYYSETGSNSKLVVTMRYAGPANCTRCVRSNGVRVYLYTQAVPDEALEVYAFNDSKTDDFRTTTSASWGLTNNLELSYFSTDDKTANRKTEYWDVSLASLDFGDGDTKDYAETRLVFSMRSYVTQNTTIYAHPPWGDLLGILSGFAGGVFAAFGFLFPETEAPRLTFRFGKVYSVMRKKGFKDMASLKLALLGQDEPEVVPTEAGAPAVVTPAAPTAEAKA